MRLVIALKLVCLLFICELAVGHWLACPGFCELPLAAEDSGSLESMWLDLPNEQTSSQENKPPPAALQTNPDTTSPKLSVAAPSDLANVEKTMAAPMCSLEAFQTSQLVAKSVWPGLGPFKAEADSPGKMFDENGNGLKLVLSQGQIIKAELSLVKRYIPGESGLDFLDLETNIDFLLEALGSKAQKILDFNEQLEKSKQSLATISFGEILNFSAGQYSIALQKAKGKDQTTNYLISINSSHAHKNVIKEHSNNQDQDVAGVSKVNAIPAKSTANLPGNISDSREISDVSVVTSTKQALTTNVISDAHTDREDLNEQFVRLIKDWQRIKKTAVLKLRTNELTEVLAGKALQRQSEAVKWLISNHKYYEMVPKEVIVDKYFEIIPAKKYTVLAQVRELSKFIDEFSKQVLKETDNTYKVNYTIEKVANRWYITDSALLSTTRSGPASRPSSGKNLR